MYHMSWIQLSFVLSLIVSGLLGEKIYVNQSSPYAADNSSCWSGGIDKPCATFDFGLRGLQASRDQSGGGPFELIVVTGNYTFNSTETGNFSHAANIAMIGLPYDSSFSPSVTVTCYEEVGLSFEYSKNITIRGIKFDGCCQLRNSTSAFTSKKEFVLAYVSLYFLYCEDIILIDVTVQNTRGIAVILYNVVGKNQIDSCTFQNNIFDNQGSVSGGGGVYIEYSFCVPTEKGTDCLETGNSNVNETYTSDSHIHVVDSKFLGNVANLSQDVSIDNTFILPHKQYHSALGRGGGISTFFKGKASDNTVIIENCSFTENYALWGGGVFAEYQDNAGNNNFSVVSSAFKANRVSFNDSKFQGTGGGGSRVGYIYFDDFSAYNNMISFRNCTFENNEAYYGGGISFYSARQPKKSKGYNNFTISNCCFSNNQARLGSAVDLSQWHSSFNGAVLSPVIEDCIFRRNTPRSGDGGLVGVGAVYVDALHLQLKGNVIFVKNNGSALAVTAAYIVIEANASLLFEENRGRNGGGLALLGNTYLVTNEHSNLTFINNVADYHGGAIYFYSSGERDLISSRNCLIRYSNISLPPQKWNSKFTFRGNLANNKTNSIFASSVLPCLWGGASGNTSEYVNAAKAFCWNDNWKYYDSSGGRDPHCTNQISSAPSKFNSNKNNFNSTYIPGDVPINLSSIFNVANDFNVAESAVLIASLRGNDKSYRFQSNENFNYLSHENLYLFGKPKTSVIVQIETLDPIVVQKHLTIVFDECPPGFKDSDLRCVCAGNYNGYISCNATGYESTITNGAWMGNCSQNERNSADGIWRDPFCVGVSPYVYLATADVSIPLGKKTEGLNDVLCSKSNREGVLCGKCKKGFGVAVNSVNFKCMKCSNEDEKINWLFYLLTEFLPITIFFATVFVFSMTLTSGPLNSFVFFAQIINSGVKIGAEGMVPLENFFSTHKNYDVLKTFYAVPYDIWNLDFFASLNDLIPTLNFCLGEHFNTLSILTLQYITALYPLLLLLIFIAVLRLYNQGHLVNIFRPMHNCLSRFRQRTGLTQSISGGFAVFIVISYTKFTLISNMLLSKSPLYNSSGHKKHTVFYFDGEVNFLSHHHEGLRYILVAILVICTFVAIPPILLAYPSILKFLERLSKGRIPVGRIYPHHKVQMFLDEFHGCYKDGSDGQLDCRWFASLYFFLRIAMFVIYGQTDHWGSQYLIQILLFLCMALLFFTLRPYRKEWINSLDAAMFVNLAAISAISLYNLQLARIGEKLNMVAFILQIILVFLPLIYCTAYYTSILIKPRFHGWNMRTRRRSDKLNRLVVGDQGYNSSGDERGMEDNTHVDDFLDYIENSDPLVRNSNSNSSPCNSEATPLFTAESGSVSNQTPPTTNPSYGAAKGTTSSK